MRKFIIEIETDNEDAPEVVREATRIIANQVDWGSQSSASIEATEDHMDGTYTYLAGYEMAP